MTSGLQTIPSTSDLAASAPGADLASLKAAARIAGLSALAGGGAAILLYTLLRPRPEYEPTGSDRVRQSTENAIPLRTQRLGSSARPANDSDGLFQQEPSGSLIAGQAGVNPEFAEPEFAEPEFAEFESAEPGSSAAPERRLAPEADPRRSRPPSARQQTGQGARGASRRPATVGPGSGEAEFGAEAGAEAEEFAADDFATDNMAGAAGASQSGQIRNPAQAETMGTAPFEPPQLDGPYAEQPFLEQPTRPGNAGSSPAGATGINLDAAPPDVSAWLDGPVATLRELPLLGQQADTLPQLSPQPLSQQAEAGAIAAQPSPQDGIYVENFAITGNTVFSAEELAQVARAAVFPDAVDSEPSDSLGGSQVGMVLSPAELVQASDAITEFYTQQGYVNSGAYVPEDVLRGAPPEIRVIEGKLESINVVVKTPNSFGLSQPMSEGYVEGRLAQAGGGTLNLNRLVDGVRLLELDPLIESISTELVPGSVTGSSILNVEVQQAKTFAAGLTLNNYRSPSIGSFTQGLSVQQSNILGKGDTAQFGYSRSSGSNSLDFGYSLPINAKDGTISLRHSRNSSRVVEDPFSALDAVSKSRLTELKLRQPIIKKPDEELAASLTLSRYYSEASLLDDLPLTSSSTNDEGETRISALRFGQEWSKKGEKQFMALQSQFSLGLGGLLGGDVREEGQDSRFLAWRGKGRLVRSLGPDAIASLKGEVQLTPNSLAPVERFSVGGPTTVRGYRQNTVLTDAGWLASAEAQVPVLRFPKWKSVVQLAPFVDMGGGWNVNGEQPEQGFLASTGIGAILRVGDDFSARLDYGIPLTRRESSGNSLQDAGLSFSINLTPF